VPLQTNTLTSDTLIAEIKKAENAIIIKYRIKESRKTTLNLMNPNSFIGIHLLLRIIDQF
jgi:hypothetical protein